MSENKEGNFDLGSHGGQEAGALRVFIIGFMGCGKTHWGKYLAQKLQVPFFDLDEKIAEQEGRMQSLIFLKMKERNIFGW